MVRTGRPPVTRQTVYCESCGRAIERRTSDIARNKHQRFFCSAECRNKVGVKPRKGVERPCQACGKTMYVRPGAQDRQKFCSRECHNQWQGRNRVERTCEWCSRVFSRPPAWESRQAARFCSRQCESESRLKRRLPWEHNGRSAVLDKQGYVRVFEPSHSKAMRRGWVFHHRLVVELALGRVLGRDEHVHHVNGVKNDNRLDNLVVMDANDHLLLSGVDYRQEQQAIRDELAEYRRLYGPIK